jgi:hypothetical protein
MKSPTHQGEIASAQQRIATNDAANTTENRRLLSMPLRKLPLILLLVASSSLLLLAGCWDSETPVPAIETPHIDNAVVFSEKELASGIIAALTPERSILTLLESSSSSSNLSDTGGIGFDEFAMTFAGEATVDLCFLMDNRKHTLRILKDGTELSAMTSQSTGYNCATDAIEPLVLTPGNYTVRIQHDTGVSDDELLLSLKAADKLYSAAAPESQAAGSVRSIAAKPSTALTLQVTPVNEYSRTSSYPGNSIVSYKSIQYANKYWAGPGECPIEVECPYNPADQSGFKAGQWAPYDPNVKHEFDYYDYQKITGNYPVLKPCAASDYGLSAVQSVLNTSIASGEIAIAAPRGGYSQQDKDALYREYMLPCMPDLAAAVPDNVATVKRVLPKSLWDQLASKTYSNDASLTYMSTRGASVAWPAESGFKLAAYDNFLAAVARYPYFCGETGYFSSVDEACKRELASLFAHAAQETGNTSIYESFAALRELFVNGSSFFKGGCSAPFDCASNGFARYYGRGPKQVSYYYNYAGFSAAYFNGDFNFLLKWPDMVAWDGKMYFESALWFVMTNQPPKPSIHDVILGRYKPDASCVTQGKECFGMQTDAVSGVKNNFNVTIEVVNGGPECRGLNQNQSTNRSNGYAQMLDLLLAQKTDAEKTPLTGCDFIASNGAPATSVFVSPMLAPKLNTWIDMSMTTCQAQASGGDAMISVTATGIVTACNNR